MLLEKECTLTFFCLQRPLVKLFLMDNGQKHFIGNIKYDFNCCDYNYTITDKNGARVSKIHADCCQLGICCSEYNFNCVNEVEMEARNSQGQVTTIKKMGKGFFKNMLTDTQKMVYYVPREMNWE